MRSSTDRRRVPQILLPLLVLGAMVAASTGCMGSAKKSRLLKMSSSHVAVAQKLFTQQRMQEALGMANRAIEESKKNPEAYLVRGQILFAIEEYDRAIDDFTAANDLRPPFADALSWRGWTKAETGDMEGAEKDWKRALEDTTSLTPEKVYLNLALLYQRTGRKSLAMENLERAVTVNPAYSRGHFELGKARQEAGNTSGAIVSYEAALGGMKDSPDLNLRLGLVLESSGEGARAREYFKRVLELDPEGTEATTARDHLKRLEPSS